MSTETTQAVKEKDKAQVLDDPGDLAIVLEDCNPNAVPPKLAQELADRTADVAHQLGIEFSKARPVQYKE